MSCLDVMYPAYGHYAPYAPTAPAFINSLQVGSDQYFSNDPEIIVLTVSVSGAMAAADEQCLASLCVKAKGAAGIYIYIYIFNYLYFFDVIIFCEYVQ